MPAFAGGAPGNRSPHFHFLSCRRSPAGPAPGDRSRDFYFFSQNGRGHYSIVIAGLVPAIHGRFMFRETLMDARDEPGHDSAWNPVFPNFSPVLPQSHCGTGVLKPAPWPSVAGFPRLRGLYLSAGLCQKFAFGPGKGESSPPPRASPVYLRSPSTSDARDVQNRGGQFP